MTQKFTTPCFIRKNTEELRKKLEELGYSIMCGYDIGFIITCPNFGVAFLPVGPKVKVDENNNGEYIDCGTNENLFLAIAALRKDSDYMQWFTNGVHWYLCESNVFENSGLFDKEYSVRIKDGNYYHKASVEELIKHFKI